MQLCQFQLCKFAISSDSSSGFGGDRDNPFLLDKFVKLHFILEFRNPTPPQEAVDSLWPCTWQGAMKLLQQAGFRPPKTLHVCLNDSHYGLGCHGGRKEVSVLWRVVKFPTIISACQRRYALIVVNDCVIV